MPEEFTAEPQHVTSELAQIGLEAMERELERRGIQAECDAIMIVTLHGLGPDRGRSHSGITARGDVTEPEAMGHYLLYHAKRTLEAAGVPLHIAEVDVPDPSQN